MELVLLRRMVIISSILGAILGVVTVIPAVNVLSFFAIMFLASPFVILYMTKYNMMGVLNLKQTLIYGAIIGFISFLGFSLTFVPLATIIGLIYKNSFYLGVSMLFREGFFVMLLMVVFVALLGGALMNSFSALIYHQIRTYFFKDEIDDNILNDNIDYEIGE